MMKLCLNKEKIIWWKKYFKVWNCKYNGICFHVGDDINGWLYHRIRMCIWKQWKKPRTKYKNLVKLGIPEHYAATIANSRRKYWYISNNKAVIWALNKERLINSGFYDLATAYQSVHVNYWKRRIPNGTYGAVRGRRLVTASYSISNRRDC